MLLMLALLAADPSAVAAAPPAVKEKKICRRGGETGSMMPMRICKTAAEWAEIDKANGENASRFNENKNDARGSY